MAAPVSFEFERAVSSSNQTGKCELSAGKLELSECLFERSSASAPLQIPYSTTQVRKQPQLPQLEGRFNYEKSKFNPWP